MPMKFYRIFQWILAYSLGIILSFNSQGQQIENKIRLAVLYFENNSSTNREALAPLAKGLCDMMIGDIRMNHHVDVIERTRLEEILKEMKMTHNTAFDKKSTQQIGKLLGVHYLVFGSYFDLFGKFRIDARIVKVETGEIFAATGLTGKQDEFDLIEKMLVEKLLLQIIPPQLAETKHDIMKATKAFEKKASITLRGAVEYGQALSKVDSGDIVGATALLKDIVESNPDFALAAQMLKDFEQ